jgi:hypothetical protein
LNANSTKLYVVRLLKIVADPHVEAPPEYLSELLTEACADELSAVIIGEPLL